MIFGEESNYHYDEERITAERNGVGIINNNVDAFASLTSDNNYFYILMAV